MSAVVLKFPTKPRAAPVAEFPAAPVFYCTTCDSLDFRIYTGGDIYCAKCKAHIKNLFARQI